MGGGTQGDFFEKNPLAPLENFCELLVYLSRLRFRFLGRYIMFDVLIRRYADSDRATLECMIGDRYEREYLSSDCHESINTAKCDGVVAGFSYASIYYGDSRVFVFVLPDYRRRGIGSALYDKAEKEARAADCRSVWSTYYDVENAAGFVGKVGVTQIKGNDFMVYTGELIPENDTLIRPYRDEDFSRYSRITSRAWHELRVRTGDTCSKIIEPTDEERQKNRDSDSCYVIEDAGRVVGGGSFALGEDGNYHIDAICVDTEFYNRGYGKALAIFLTNEILRRGKSAAYLNVEHGNHNAKHIYESIGYKKIYTGYTPIKIL